MRPINPLGASWLPRRSAGPKPALPSWLAPRPAAAAQPVPFAASQRPVAVSAAPPPPPVEPQAEAPVIVPRPSPVPHDVLAEAALHEENDVLRADVEQLRAENDALRAENAALAARLEESAGASDRLRAQAVRDAEPELVRLALAVAERVVGRELAANPAVVASWAREAVDALLTREGLSLTVSADVAAAVPTEAWERTFATPPPIAVDVSLPPHSCSVRAGPAAAEAGLSARLSAMRDALEGGDP